MAFCSHCGAQVGDGAKFCPKCGSSVAPSVQNDFSETVKNLNNTADYSARYNPSDINNNKVFAILSYLWILVLIPIFAAKQSPFARYHANQGLVLLICEIAAYIVVAIVGAIFTAITWRLFWIGSLLYSLVSLATLIFIILGIVNAASGKCKDLPIIGRVRILK